MEKRELVVEDLHELSLEQEEEMVVGGYALKWGQGSHPISTDEGYFIETFTNGAFDETLQNDEQLILYGHEVNNVLGRTSNGTAKLEVDEVGLMLTVKLPNTTLGRDTFELVKRNDLGGMSVGFIALEDNFTFDGEEVKRTINKAKLIEVSLVPVPAYDSSDVSERAKNNVEIIVTKNKEEEEKRQRLFLLTQI